MRVLVAVLGICTECSASLSELSSRRLVRLGRHVDLVEDCAHEFEHGAVFGIVVGFKFVAPVPKYRPGKWLNCRGKTKAGARIRTADLLITNQLLYRLSYASAPECSGWSSLREPTV
jgi:hypothetical protein